MLTGGLCWILMGGATHRLITNHPSITGEEGLGWSGGEGGGGGGGGGSKTSSCPSVVAGQSSGIRLSRLSYLDDAPSPLSSSWLAVLEAIVS